MVINNEITLDISKQTQFVKLSIPQGDNIDRVFKINLVNGSDTYVIPSTSKVRFEMTRKDGSFIYNNCPVEDNQVILEITPAISAVDGRFPAQFRITDSSTGGLIKSFRFHILIHESVDIEKVVINTSEFTALQDMELRVGDIPPAIQAAETATNNANSAATNANNKANQLENETLIIWKPYVSTYINIATTYPTPELGWTTQAQDTGIRWRYNGTEWINIGVSTDDKVGDMSTATTTNKTNVVGAINEVNSQLADIVKQADNYNTLQNAIDNTPDNGTLILKSNKTYSIDTELSLTNNIKIDGRGATINVNSANGIIGSGILKTTKTVTADYVIGDYSITLSDVDGIEKGDLLNIVSTELYDTSRLYYFKGGNVLASSIDVGNKKVTISMAFPFSMSAETITVKVYKPITVKLKNINLQGKGILPFNKFGIKISHGVDCKFENINIDNFCTNISYDRLINTKVLHVHTGHAKNSNTDMWDGYGHGVTSCNMIKLEQCNTKSGQHGITWGGHEVNFGLVIDGCTIDNECQPYGLGAHENIFDVSIKNSKIYGFTLAGNATMENCDIFAPKDNTKINVLSSAENTKQANYEFKNCRFNGSEVTTADYYQVSCPTRKYIGNIIFDNCKDIRTVRMNINFSSTGNKIGEVSNVIVVNCEDVKVDIYDNVNTLIVDGNTFTSKTATNFITQLEFTPQGRIENIEINNNKMDKAYNGIFLCNAGIVKINNLRLLANELGSSSMTLKNIDELVIENSNLSGFARGVELMGTITKLVINNAKIQFLSQGTAFTNCTAVVGKNWVNFADGFIYDIYTTQTGIKKKAYINDSNELTISTL